MFPGETILSGSEPLYAFRVLASGAGWYIGTEDLDGQPNSRESDYFANESEARETLYQWYAAAEIVGGEEPRTKVERLRGAYKIGILEHART